MSLSSSSMELNHALKELRVLWEETKDSWDDVVRHDFEENYWIPLETQLVAVLRAMERLAPVLITAQRDSS